MAIVSLVIGAVLAVCVAVIGQFIIKLVLDPLVKFKETLGNISALFLREQQKIYPGGISFELNQELNKIASELIASYKAVPWYGFCSKCFSLPSAENIHNARSSITSIASMYWRDKKEVKEVKEGQIVNVYEVSREQCYEWKTDIQNKLGIVVSYEQCNSEQTNDAQKSSLSGKCFLLDMFKSFAFGILIIALYILFTFPLIVSFVVKCYIEKYSSLVNLLYVFTATLITIIVNHIGSGTESIIDFLGVSGAITLFEIIVFIGLLPITIGSLLGFYFKTINKKIR